MLFWIVAALLTLAASLAVIVPLAGRPRPDSAADHDIEVYRDQFQELERDAARGLIGAAEADEAKAEIGRRILRLADAPGEKTAAATPGRTGRLVGAAAVLAVPIVAWGVYATVGSPYLPSQPLSARLEKNPAESTLDELIARAEGHLASNPEDGRGWDVLAPVYLRGGRFADSATAYRNAMRLLGESPDRLAGLGEALAGAAGGLVTAESRAAFDQAAALAPDNPKSRFYLATALAQEGRLEEAAAAWRAMLDRLPADSPWRGATQEAIAEASRRIAAGSPPAPGPTEDDVEAAASMSAGDRAAMIEQMVSGLDAKLRQNPNDAEGWMRLVRSYAMLGRTDQARDALARGIKAVGGDSEDGKRLAALAASLGLSSTQ